MQNRSHYLKTSLPAYPKIALKLWLASSLTLFYLGCGSEVLGQIASDGTLSTNVTTTDNLNFTINDGDRAGNNLFHSFREFSVPTGGEAFFNNAADIQNIFSRVTGNSISNIDGLIRANGTANLFLINPNGIIFGQNAKLNIGGSFLGSTASSIKFSDGVEFSATNPQTSALLSINVPIGLQYKANTGEIRVQGRGQAEIQTLLLYNILANVGATKSFDSSLNPLEVTPGKNLTIVGGNVIIDGGILQAPGGGVEIGGLAGEGTVGLNSDGSLSFPEGVVRADMSIINKAGINVLAGGGGSIAITGKNIDISGESMLSVGIASNLGSPESIAGDISLGATEVVAIDSSLIHNNVAPYAVGNSGNVSITAKTILVTHGSELDASTRGQGNAGSVTIVASDAVTFDGVWKDGCGCSSGASSDVGTGAEGDAGGVSITAKSLVVTNGAQLSASTFGQGNAGSVTIMASDTVTFDGVGSSPSGAYSSVQPGAEGDAGGMSITAKSLVVTNGAQLLATTFGQGNAGSVTIMASDTVTFDGAGKSRFFSGAYSSVQSGVQGDAGGVSITAKSLVVTNGGTVNSNSRGKGAAGDIVVDADSIRLNNLASISSNTVGGKGNINLRSSSLILRQNSGITTNATGSKDIGGGNITLNTGVLAALENSDITANAQEGKGGEIAINAQAIFGGVPRTRQELELLLNTTDPNALDPRLLPSSDITAISQQGGLQFEGNIAVNTPDVEPTSGLLALPPNLFDATRIVASTCRPKGGEPNRFIVTGRGGLPPNPIDEIPDKATWFDLRPRLVSQTQKTGDLPTTNSQLHIPNFPIMEAQGWVTNAQGEVILIAQASTATPSNSGLAQQECSAP